MTPRILLVEDDPVSSDLILSLLTCRGYDVDTAADGFGALRMAQDQRYDLVLVDYHLPEMDGYALARLMRTLGATSNADLKMVAITADRFGLAARRGVDSIFDSMLSKPIEPKALYAFLDDLFVPSATADLDAFLEPKPEAAQSAAQVLWRARGLDDAPAVAVFPAPTPAERASLDYCFRLVEPEAADCLVLLRPAGAAEVARLRAGAVACLQPLVTLDEANASFAEVFFKVGDGESWTAVAAIIKTFAERRRLLDFATLESADLDTRLAAYLFLAERPLILRRDRVGRTTVRYSGGFAAAAVIDAVKRLAAQNHVAAKMTGSSTEESELSVDLTARGRASVAIDTARAAASGI